MKPLNLTKMSKIDEVLIISPVVVPGSLVEELVSKTRECSYCGGRGHFLEPIGKDESLEIDCPVCKGTGLLQAKITICWTPGNGVSPDQKEPLEIIHEQGRVFNFDEIADYEEMTKLEYITTRVIQAMLSNKALLVNVDRQTNQNGDIARELMVSEAVKWARVITDKCKEEQA